MVKAKPKEYEDAASPGGFSWRLRLAPGSKSGYYGVINNKGKWQGMGYDSTKQKRRPLPGLHERPQDAAVQVARFQALVKSGAENIPSQQRSTPLARGTGERNLVVTCKAGALCLLDRSLSILSHLRVSSRGNSKRR